MTPLSSDRAFRAAVRHLHRLGTRPFGELLGEVAAAVPTAAPVIIERLEVYGRLDPYTVLWCGADQWLEPEAVIRVVAGGRS
jgi:hypothetical protein